MKAHLILAVFSVVSIDALAQRAPSTGVRAADPAAPVPQVSYRSAFDGYVPYREQPLASWREVNDEVGRVGGHVGIFRSGVHASQGHGTPSKPAPGEGPSSTRQDPAGQAPARGAPKAPAVGHHGH
jgi:hypothetical protein